MRMCLRMCVCVFAYVCVSVYVLCFFLTCSQLFSLFCSRCIIVACTFQSFFPPTPCCSDSQSMHSLCFVLCVFVLVLFVVCCVVLCLLKVSDSMRWPTICGRMHASRMHAFA